MMRRKALESWESEGGAPASDDGSIKRKRCGKARAAKMTLEERKASALKSSSDPLCEDGHDQASGLSLHNPPQQARFGVGGLPGAGVHCAKKEGVKGLRGRD